MCTVFLYGHEVHVFMKKKKHCEQLGMAPSLAIIPSRRGQESVGVLPHMFKSHVSLLCSKTSGVKSQSFVRCHFYVPERDKEGLQKGRSQIRLG